MIYGLFHGLVFFPVILSLIGPPPFSVNHSNGEVPISPDELEPQLSAVKKEVENEITVHYLNLIK